MLTALSLWKPFSLGFCDSIVSLQVPSQSPGRLFSRSPSTGDGESFIHSSYLFHPLQDRLLMNSKPTYSCLRGISVPPPHKHLKSNVHSRGPAPPPTSNGCPSVLCIQKRSSQPLRLTVVLDSSLPMHTTRQVFSAATSQWTDQHTLPSPCASCLEDLGSLPPHLPALDLASSVHSPFKAGVFF